MLTSLADNNAFPTEALANFYTYRWRIETSCCDINHTMGMDHLRSRGPQMVEK